MTLGMNISCLILEYYIKCLYPAKLTYEKICGNPWYTGEVASQKMLKHYKHINKFFLTKKATRTGYSPPVTALKADFFLKKKQKKPQKV